jgi:hypothetical protein
MVAAWAEQKVVREIMVFRGADRRQQQRRGGDLFCAVISWQAWCGATYGRPLLLRRGKAGAVNNCLGRCRPSLGIVLGVALARGHLIRLHRYGLGQPRGSRTVASASAVFSDVRSPGRLEKGDGD